MSIKFLIGTDPEFIITNKKGQVIAAQDLCVAGDNSFGVDGNHVSAEIRPKPSENPLQVISNIHEILVRKNNTDKRFLDFEFLAGSFQKNYCIGGHIHLGLKGVIKPEEACQILDQYLGFASILLEDTEQGIRRRQEHNGDYGQASSFRPKNWGFEYRTPSSWMTSPHIAASILCLTKTVMHEVLNNKKFSPNPYVMPMDFQQIPYIKLRNKFPAMWREVTKMELYQDYKIQLDLIYNLVIKGKHWFPIKPMKEAWGVIDLKSPVSERRNKMLLDTIWAKYRGQIID